MAEPDFILRELKCIEEATGYSHVEKIDTYGTHPIHKFKTPEGEIVVVKYDYNDNNFSRGLRKEKGFSDHLIENRVEGVAKCLVSRTIKLWDGHPYWPSADIVVKEYLPGRDLGEVISSGELTKKMREQVYETMAQMHEVGVGLEREVYDKDFVLDENERPTLVDFEFMRWMAASFFDRNYKRPIREGFRRLKIIRQDYKALESFLGKKPKRK